MDKENEIQELRSLIISKRNTRKREDISRIINDFSENPVEVEFLDSFSVILTFPGKYSKRFVLLEGDGFFSEETVDNRIDALCEGVVDS